MTQQAEMLYHLVCLCSVLFRHSRCIKQHCVKFLGVVFKTARKKRPNLILNIHLIKYPFLLSHCGRYFGLKWETSCELLFVHNLQSSINGNYFKIQAHMYQEGWKHGMTHTRHTLDLISTERVKVGQKKAEIERLPHSEVKCFLQFPNQTGRNRTLIPKEYPFVHVIDLASSGACCTI